MRKKVITVLLIAVIAGGLLLLPRYHRPMTPNCIEISTNSITSYFAQSVLDLGNTFIVRDMDGNVEVLRNIRSSRVTQFCPTN